MALIETLRRDILAGRLPPGSLLMQTELATRFGVSRIPVRDALQALAAERLVTVVPGKGARVIRLGPQELAEVYDLRILLECDLIHRAARQATPAQRDEAAHVLARSDLEAGRPGWEAGDRAYHMALYAPANRPRQVALVNELRDATTLHIIQYQELADHTSHWLDDHHQIFSAWRAGQAASAAALLAAHLTAARDHLLRRIADQTA
ncbi:GntR family transcriptional regulator [Gemmobacter sp. LW-1]|uniref:GntR family transcriptional regulator n=1 Tax=Gemmobacter sp. LW-1 TaxID=1529005 RepID=UPI0006C7736B|nr:GntR family transcriptional regulator [Gemmobacter sp. LW-1]